MCLSFARLPICACCIYKLGLGIRTQGLYNNRTNRIHMLSLAEIKERLKDRNLAHVARETGLSHMTVWKIRNNAEGCSYATAETLSDYLEENL